MEFHHICIVKNENLFLGNLDETMSKIGPEGYLFNVTELGFAPGWCLQVFISENLVKGKITLGWLKT